MRRVTRGLARGFGQKNKYEPAEYPLEYAAGALTVITFGIVAYVGYNYEHLMVQYGLVDPKEHKKRKQADLNPLPMELRDEYINQIKKERRESRTGYGRPPAS